MSQFLLKWIKRIPPAIVILTMLYLSWILKGYLTTDPVGYLPSVGQYFAALAMTLIVVGLHKSHPFITLIPSAGVLSLALIY